MTPWRQERVLEHAAGCEVCGPRLPRNVSAARVFALLPAPALSPLARAEVLDFFDEQRLAAYREFAASRTAALAEWGFPVIAGPPDPAPALAALAEATEAAPEPHAPARGADRRPGGDRLGRGGRVHPRPGRVARPARRDRGDHAPAGGRLASRPAQAQPSGLGTVGAIGLSARPGRGRTQEVWIEAAHAPAAASTPAAGAR